MDQFETAYPNVSAGAEEETAEDPPYCSLDRTVDVGEGHNLRINVSMVPRDDEELEAMMNEDDTDFAAEDGAEVN